MSDKLLNKIQIKIKNKQKGITFKQKELQKENKVLISELDKRINDMLHKIEFTNATQEKAYSMYMKLQSFLKKKRALKSSGNIYTPRTETGNFIINGNVIKKEK